ncbi:MAG: sigma-54-dependent Fis family transcriptional regulator [Alphaproteobacteria bacterium]|nr:sigma-54-dependent Fis family transcriptional regulator [Alphaproteobacteria bacterium]
MRLLIIGTLNGQVTTAAKIALSRGAKVAQVDDIDQALVTLRGGKGADLVMVDVSLDIAQLIAALKAERFHIPVVACGIGSDASAAVRAIKAGAKEYLPLPPNAELIAAVLAAVTEESSSILFRDASMRDTLRLADQIAASEASVLICGESGTGKELLARYVHKKSKRGDKVMVSVNCAAIPENLLESELFGHEKGAFTGAVARRIGKFEEANGGTLLLDEISEMDIRLQAKLLRAIQEREIDRVGGTQPIKVDIRVLATTNRDLESEVRAGRFREDLFYRLNVVTLRLPALRDRPGDIELLAEHFVRKYTEANGTPPRVLGPEATGRLRAHGWSGNVRELENTVHRAVLLATGDTIGPEAVVLSGATRQETRTSGPGDAAAPVAPGARGLVGRTVADVERDLIIDTLSHCLGNRTHAANILGISIRTLRNKLKQYGDEGVRVPPPRDGERLSA